MADFIFLMHDDAAGDAAGDWDGYLSGLRSRGVFQGGSEIGAGRCFRKSGQPGPFASHIGGFIRVEAADLAAAAELLTGNPVFEAGWTVEIRQLPTS